jgi:hypothetical protein
MQISLDFDRWWRRYVERNLDSFKELGSRTHISALSVLLNISLKYILYASLQHICNTIPCFIQQATIFGVLWHFISLCNLIIYKRFALLNGEATFYRGKKLLLIFFLQTLNIWKLMYRRRKNPLNDIL